MDVEDIAPGQRFAQQIDDKIADCDTALIIIGPKWAEILHKRAQDQQPDYVRHEIEAALARQITIVPVLVGGGSVAELSGLSGNLSALSQYEAAELRDDSFAEDCVRLANSLRLRPSFAWHWRALAVLLGAAVLIGLLLAGSAWIGIGPWSEYRARKATIGQMLATARTQAERTEYESAFRTYQSLLKIDPGNAAVMKLQVDAAMGWLQNFHVIVPEGGKAEDQAGALLAEIAPVLDAGLAKTNGQGPRAGDILAHIGWWHWLNQKIAEREFGPAAERDLRRALVVDPPNVFAHAMLGNWIMQTGGQTQEALQHFRMAVERKQERSFVRRLQLAALIYPRDREARTALIQAANEMRRNGEPIEDGERSRILSVYSPTVNSAREISETLSAVPPDDAWATYLWLDNWKREGSELDWQRAQHDFIHASLLEIEGKRQEALAAFEKLRGELKLRGYNGRIATHVESALTRLATP